MILTCSSCNKKFVVPDKAITASGRMVQCGSCGNKWKQYPLGKKTEDIIPNKTVSKKVDSPPKTLKRKVPKKAKVREISLYSPEYLAKKHGIKIDDAKPEVSTTKSKNEKKKVTLGFYSSLLIFLVLAIFFSRALYFSQSFIINIFPESEYYLNYFFENIKNLFEIWKSLVSNY